MLAHEYSIIGHDRAKVGRWLSIAAAVIASMCSILLTGLLHLAQWLGVSAWLPHAVLLPVTAAVIWPFAYFAFNAWAWRMGPVRAYLDIPDLRGEWQVSGETLDGSNRTGSWTGTIAIEQRWDKIKVGLVTATSTSHSIMATIVHDPTRGHVLMYTYENEPRLGVEHDIHGHKGYCEIVFDKVLATGEAEYFNNFGRTSYGRMKLARKES